MTVGQIDRDDTTDGVRHRNKKDGHKRVDRATQKRKGKTDRHRKRWAEPVRQLLTQTGLQAQTDTYT